MSFLAQVKIKKKTKKTCHILASFSEHFWAFYWGPFWDQIGQRGGKMSPREPSGASKSQKAAFSKTLKNLQFFSVFGCRGLRELQEAREGSQETPKETPMGGPIRGKKVAKKWTRKWAKKTISESGKSRSDRLWFGAFFGAKGLSKMAHCEDVKKLLKMLKNGPNMIKKRFKIA